MICPQLLSRFSSSPAALAFRGLAVVAALSSSLPATAQTPLGTEFLVNTYTTGLQGDRGVSAAADGSGNFVVVWTSAYGQDGDFHGVFAQRFDSGGSPQGPEFQVNTYTTSVQGRSGSAVAADAVGNFVVVWSGTGSGDYDGVFAQRFDSGGSPQGPEFQVNTYTTGVQGGYQGGDYGGVAVAASAGGFVVVWTDRYQVDYSTDVFGQRFDSSGNPQGTEFQVNTYTTDDQGDRGLSVAVDASGNFVVVWSGTGNGDYDGVFAQRFDSSGSPQGGEFLVNTYTTNTQGGGYGRFGGVSVAADGSGSFVVVWSSYYQDGSGSGVFGKRYDSSGSPQGGEFQVNTYTTSYQGSRKLDVAVNAAGGFVVVWNSENQVDYASSYSDVFGQRYDSNGNPQGGEFLVNTYTSGIEGRKGLAVTATAGDQFVVVWDGAYHASPPDDLGVFAQRFGGLVTTTSAPTTTSTTTTTTSSTTTTTNPNDPDGDGVNDPLDNCPTTFNPAQENVDGDATGDACDPCPARRDDNCDPDGSASALIGPAGGSFSTTNGAVTIQVPSGSLSTPTLLTITDNTSGFFLDLFGAPLPVFKVHLGPENQHFDPPVTITFAWKDDDDDGIVDNTNNKAEVNLVLRRETKRISKNGLGGLNFRCADHQSGGGCETAVADCTDPPGQGNSAVAQCCDTVNNKWTIQACDFSEYILGLDADALIPGRRTPVNDCLSEWIANNPLNPLDRLERPNRRQSCTDGDVLCDADGTANGACVFEIAVCLNVDDHRLLNRDGSPACTPTDVGVWNLRSPRTTSSDPVKAAAAVAVRDAVASLGSATLGGRHDQEITFGPAIAAPVCTDTIQVTVPLRGVGLTRRGSLPIRAHALPTTDRGDPNRLLLTCVPSGS